MSPSTELKDNPECESRGVCWTPLDFCGQLDQPGLAVNFQQYVNYSSRQTTVDQSRIEQYLGRHAVQGKCILHVGIGNSMLASTFQARGAKVTGLTVSTAEEDHARGLKLPGYKVLRLNKYEPSFTRCIDAHSFDFIIDNNMAAFACCRYHLLAMFDHYLWALKPGAFILTDQRGMDWALADPSFILDFDSLSKVVEQLPVSVHRLTEMVYGIKRLSPHDDGKESLNVYVRHADGNSNTIRSFNPEEG